MGRVALEAPLLAPSAAGDDVAAAPAAAPAAALGAAAAANDPYDFTKWDLTDLPSIPLGESSSLMKATLPHVVLGMLLSSWLSTRMTSSASIPKLPDHCMRDTRIGFYTPSSRMI
jgi:hypothetical protein